MKIAVDASTPGIDSRDGAEFGAGGYLNAIVPFERWLALEVYESAITSEVPTRPAAIRGYWGVRVHLCQRPQQRATRGPRGCYQGEVPVSGLPSLPSLTNTL